MTPNTRNLQRYFDALKRQSLRQVLARAWNRLDCHTRPLRPLPLGDDSERTSTPLPLALESGADHAILSLLASGAVTASWRAPMNTGDDALTNDLEAVRNRQRFRLFGRALAREAAAGDMVARQELIRTIENWLAGSAERMDLAMESLSVALRVREWTWILLLTAPHGVIPARLVHAMLRSIRAQAARLRRHVEHDVPGNHPIACYFALFLAEVVAGGGAMSDRARRVARRLEREAMASFLRDGFHVELSLHYHVQVLRMLEEYVAIARAPGDVPSAEFSERLDLWRSVVRDFAVPGAPLPLLGDNGYSFFDDDASVDALTLAGLHPERYVRDATAPLQLTESALWTKALRPPDATGGSMRAAPSVRWFEDAGYLLARRDRGVDSDFFLFDCGPLGFPRNPGHAHADCLSVSLYVRGVPLLVDPGTYRYGDSEQCLWFKRAAAHNTLAFSGHEPADLWRFFRWCNLPARPESAYETTPSGVRARASFRGYERTVGATHVRECTLDWSTGLRVRDTVSLRDNASSRFGFSYHFAPGWTIETNGRGWMCRKNGLAVRIDVDADIGGFEPSLTSEPVAPRYGCLDAGPVLRFSVDEPANRTTLVTSFDWQ